MQLKMSNKKIVSLVVVTLVVLYVIIGVRVVPANTVCVKTSFGKTNGFNESGVTWIAFGRDKLVCTPTSEQKLSPTDGYTVSTRDMQTVGLDVVTTYRIDQTKVGKLFNSYQLRQEEIFIDPTVKEIIQSTTARYTIEEVVEKRGQLQKELNEQITSRLKSEDIIVTNVSITDHSFSTEYNKAVEEKKVAEQAVLKAKQELEKAKIQAETNKQVTQSTSKEVLSRIYLEKWDGKLPLYVGDKGALSMLLPGVK